MPVKKLKEYLDTNGIKYVSITHSPAYTAQAVAESAHIPGKEMAKTVIVKVDGVLGMAVLPAKNKVIFDKLRNALGAKKIDFPTEQEFRDKFPECEVGAMPPFGNLYGMEVYVAKPLTEDEVIAFNACSHTEIIKMAYKDFSNLVKPKVLDFVS